MTKLKLIGEKINITINKTNNQLDKVPTNVLADELYSKTVNFTTNYHLLKETIKHKEIKKFKLLQYAEKRLTKLINIFAEVITLN